MIQIPAAARRWLVRVGTSLLALSVLLLVSIWLGPLEGSDLAVNGQSGFRVLAEIAIVGCLLAAIGYWDE